MEHFFSLRGETTRFLSMPEFMGILSMGRGEVSAPPRKKGEDCPRIPSAGPVASGELASRLLIINTTSFYFYDRSRGRHTFNKHVWPYHIPSRVRTNSRAVMKCSVLYRGFPRIIAFDPLNSSRRWARQKNRSDLPRVNRLAWGHCYGLKHVTYRDTLKF